MAGEVDVARQAVNDIGTALLLRAQP